MKNALLISWLSRALMIGILCISPARSWSAPPASWKGAAADTVAWFETSGAGYGKVTPDFDCQGLSGGVLQWNVGKGSLWASLLKTLPPATFEVAMPNYGAAFREALQRPRDVGLAYVRQFQSFADISTCDGNRRGAKWKGETGKRFESEVKALLQHPDVVARQRDGLDRKLNDGWDYARWWATSKRGADANPTYLEFVTFTDTLNFNGKWTQSANKLKVEAFRAGREDKDVFNEILDYLSLAPKGQYQRSEARKNAVLWRGRSITGEKLDLLCFAYLVAINITKDSAKPFRLNTISRRGSIIFGDGWVNGERKSFPITQ